MEDKKTIKLQDGSVAEYVISTAQYENRDGKTGRERGIEQFTEYRVTITDPNKAKHAVKVFKNLTGEWETGFQHEEGTVERKNLFRKAIDEGGAVRNG
jgi:hypothetical protein